MSEHNDFDVRVWGKFPHSATIHLDCFSENDLLRPEKSVPSEALRPEASVSSEPLFRPEAAGEAAAAPSYDEDAALVAAVVRKDRKATAQFVERCADHVYGYVRARLAPRYDQVGDLVQEVFLAAWKSLPQYRGGGSLNSWMLGIARHKVEDYYRQRLRVPEPLEEGDCDTAALEPVFDFQQDLDREHLRNKMRSVMQELPEQYRLALLWRYWEKASTREMAEKTGKTEKAVERLLARARAEFRERWSRA